MLSGEELAELAMLEAYRQYGEDPWLFVKECCRTKDEADGGKVKSMPDKGYLRYVTEVWREESLLAIPKSRRMLMTWLFLCLHLWAALTRPNAAVFIQSKKQEDSEFLLGEDRLMFVYRQLPQEFPWPALEKAMAGKSGKGYAYLRFANGSYVAAVGQGPDQLRQYTASRVSDGAGFLGVGGGDVRVAAADDPGGREGDNRFERWTGFFRPAYSRRAVKVANLGGKWA